MLLSHWDAGLVLAHAHREVGATRADRQIAIAEPPDQVKRQLGRLLAGKPKRIGCDRALDRLAHRRRRPEEPIGRHQAVQRLVRALEVVVLDEQRHAPLAVLEVREHGAGQEFLPQSLPEPFDLAAGLRMVRPALHMADAVALELGLELGVAPPAGVLAALVGQDLARRPVLGNTSRERLQHQTALLVVRERQTHQIARVVVQECRHVHPLVLPEQEREQVRLP